MGRIGRALASLAIAAATPVAAQDYHARLPQDEVIYFLLPDRFDNADPANDRGGLRGDRLTTGFDPTDKAFYHGGDLKGVVRRLEYIQGLGATAIWVAPIFVNKPVQGSAGHESAGYHGYWITDFTHVDPHLGTDADFKTLVDAAHARGMKVYMDIVVNHTADVIQYRECGGRSPCPYRSRADYPYQRRGGVSGASINAGFAGDGDASAANFAKLIDPRWAYTPYVPTDEKQAKSPAWLNDPIYYHNRGNSTFAGESSTMGDFFGLDDVMTEHPRVIAGFIDIYGDWIDRYGIDGFRIDTAQHVDPAFWRAFVPAMQARAKARGIPNFAIFGEVSTDDLDPGRLAEHTRVDKLPTVLDFAFWRAALDTVAGDAPTAELAKLYAADPLYEGGEDTAMQLPTFTGNHDKGRFAMFVRRAHPQASDAEVLARTMLAHAMLLTLRGAPTIYSGDEQGFAGIGDDQGAREDMFASKTTAYNTEKLVGTTKTTQTDSFGTDHPLYREIAALAKVRAATAALRRGRQIVRYAGDKPGLFAVSRVDPAGGSETLLLFNTSAAPIAGHVQVDTRSVAFDALAGTCASTSSAPGSVAYSLPAFGYAVCRAR